MTAAEMVVQPPRPTTNRTARTASAQTRSNPEEVRLVRTIRHELDTYFVEMGHFPELDITEIFGRLAAMSARVSEVRTQVVRHDDSRRLNALRTKELEPFLEEVERQFKIYSRQQAVREMEAKLAGGSYA